MAVTGKKFKVVLEELVKFYGSVDYKKMSTEVLREDILKRIAEAGTAPAEKALIMNFKKKLSKINSNDEMIMHITETMFNLMGMGA